MVTATIDEIINEIDKVLEKYGYDKTTSITFKVRGQNSIVSWETQSTF